MTQMMTMDDGVQFGLGAFETIAVERGKGILLSRHLARLGRSAQFLGLGDLAERGLTMERAAEWIGENRRYDRSTPGSSPQESAGV